MREEDLRKYIQKEVLLTESGIAFSEQELKQVWDSFANVFKVLGIGLKSMINVLALNVRVLFTLDNNKIREAFNRYNIASQRLSAEYARVIDPIIENLGPVEPLILIANPGAYLAYKFAGETSTKFEDSLQFLEDSGLIDKDFIRDFLKNPETIDSDEGPSSEDNGKNRAASAAIMQITNIKNRLDQVFGNLQRESLIREARLEVNKSQVLQSLRSAPSSIFGIADDDSSKVIALKKKEAEMMASSLKAPTDFLDKLSRAKTINDVKSAIRILKDSPISIDGIGELTPEFLENSAKRVIKTAEEKGSLEKLKTELDAEMLDEKGLLDAVKAYQMKNLLGQAMLAAKKQIIPQTEKMREVFKRKFLEDVPLELLESIDPEGALTRTVKDGLKKIDEAGKRPSI